MRAIIAAFCLAATAQGAKIFYAPGCNTNMNNMDNYMGNTMASPTPRPAAQVPSGWTLQNNIPISANFPAASYQVGEIDLPDGQELVLQDGAEIEVVDGASGAAVVVTAGQASKPECDITCHANFRDGTAALATGDLSLLPVSGTPITATDDIIFPGGTSYTLEAHGSLVFGATLQWKGMNPVNSAGSADIPCIEISPCATSNPPLRTAFGSATAAAFASYYGSAPQMMHSLTSCPVIPAVDETDVTTLTLAQNDLNQMNMRRIGTMLSAPNRVTALTSSSPLSGMCSQSSSVMCPTASDLAGGNAQTATVYVTGFRPRPDLAAMTLSAHMSALSTHIATGLSSTLGEVGSPTIVNIAYGRSTAMRLRIQFQFNVVAGADVGAITAALTMLAEEYVGSYNVNTLPSPCVTLAADVSYTCVTNAVQTAFGSAYDGVNSMSQVEALMIAAYDTARGCSAADLMVGNCSAAFTPTGLRNGEVAYRDALIAGIISASATVAPTASPTDASSSAASNPVSDATGLPMLYLIIIAAALVVLVAIIIVVTGKKKQQPEEAQRSEMAFDNPMYDDNIPKANPVATDDMDSSSLYDEPAMAVDDDGAGDAMYDEAGAGAYDDEPQPDGGYLDVDENPAEDDDEDGDEDEDEEEEEDAAEPADAGYLDTEAGDGDGDEDEDDDDDDDDDEDDDDE